MKLRWVVIVMLLIVGYGQAQVKYEREYRMSSRDVPAPALQFVNALDLNGKIKWFREEGYKRSSIEAKVQSGRQKYSIEFDTAGDIEDIEIEIKKKDLVELTHDNINHYFKSTYRKYRICKIQRQLIGKEADLIYAIHNQLVDNIIVNYEIEAKVKLDNSKELYEFLFDTSGQLILSSKIIQQNTDILEY